MDPQMSATVVLPPLARFAIALFLVLVIPSAASRLRIPNCVGFLAAGVLIGPHGLSVIPQHADVADFFGELGKLLLMLFVGLEIDLEQFNLSRLRSLLFAALTFTLPFISGMVVSRAFGYRPIAAVLVGSLLASHTLIAYPIVQSRGEAGRPAVVITVGATILTDIVSLFLLTICVGTFRSGFEPWGLVIQVVEVVAFVFVVVVGFGMAGRWLFESLGGSEEACFTLLLVITSICAVLAELIHMEGILGAFLAGLAVNAAVRSSPAKDKLQFLGNVLFIPAFFMVTGFLIDPRVLVDTLASNITQVVAIIASLVCAKWLAAEIAGRLWHFESADRGLMAALTMPQVAATLAATLVGYQTMDAAGERLLDESMLNTVLVLVVVSSLLGPLLTDRFLRRLKEPPGKTGTGRAVLGEQVSLGEDVLTTIPPGGRLPP